MMTDDELCEVAAEMRSKHEIISDLERENAELRTTAATLRAQLAAAEVPLTEERQLRAALEEQQRRDLALLRAVEQRAAEAERDAERCQALRQIFVRSLTKERDRPDYRASLRLDIIITGEMVARAQPGVTTYMLASHFDDAVDAVVRAGRSTVALPRPASSAAETGAPE